MNCSCVADIENSASSSGSASANSASANVCFAFPNATDLTFFDNCMQ